MCVGVGSIYGQWDGASVYYWGGSTVGKDIENTTKMSAAKTISKLQNQLLILIYLKRGPNFRIAKKRLPILNIHNNDFQAASCKRKKYLPVIFYWSCMQYL